MINKKLLMFVLPLAIFLIGFIGAEVYQTPGIVTDCNCSEPVVCDVCSSIIGGEFFWGVLVTLAVVVVLYSILVRILKKKKKIERTKSQDIKEESTKSDQDEPQDQGDVNKLDEEKTEEPIDEEADELMGELGLEEKGEKDEEENGN